MTSWQRRGTGIATAALLVAGLFSGPSGSWFVSRAEASHPGSGSHTYTLDADFDQGSAINVVHSIANQLQLDDTTETFPFIWVAASQRGTIVKIDTETGAVLGEYRSAPQGMGTNPSRTTVDKDGNVWVGNRDEASGNQGSVVHIGLAENGQCQDRNGNNVIDTSTGLGDIRGWSNAGGADTGGGVSTADDECIIHYVRTPGIRIRHVSVDANNNVWVGGGAFGDFIRIYSLLNSSGAILRTINMDNPADSGEPGAVANCCYGGLVDPNGILWSATLGGGDVLRFDLTKSNGDPALLDRVSLGGHTSYGMGIDSMGNIWMSDLGSSVMKISPAGVMTNVYSAGASGGRGVAVTQSDDNVWVANSGSSSVTRLTNSGAIVAIIPVGNTPTGVAIDAAGKVWVTNLGSDSASRIDPATNSVDLTVPLGPGAGPYNYSDMTGSILIGAPDSGTWTVVHDSQTAGARWGTVSWTADVPAGAALTVTASSSEDGITFGPSESVSDGADLTVADGRYLKVMVSFQRSPRGESPILYDLTVRSNQAPTVTLSPAGPMPEAGAPVSLTATASDPDGDALSYTWSLMGPGTLTAAGATATYSNDDGPASAVITVTVSDGFESASDQQTVLTYNVAPQPDAGPDLTEYWGIALAFSGAALDPSTADTLAGLNPQWDFGDMNGAMGYSASHAYADPGSYTATLTATDKDGGVGTDSAQVTIMKRPTTLVYSGDTTAPFGGAMLAADLSDAIVPGPLAGRTVTFSVDGNTLTATTDAAGHAAVAAPFGLLPGVYTVDLAYGGDSHYEESRSQATLTVANTAGKITAGTMRFPNNGRGGFNVMYKDGAVTGELQFQSDSTKFHAHTMTALSVSPDHTKGWFAGIGTDGRTFMAYVEDNGEPGTGDIFQLWINGTLVNGSGQPLSGNVQIHK
ncbi:MAG: hypothetical protein K0R39_3302 [Symbiobacteriaceae bacterium]|jgi:YVTN family beta-propeller protein|nr:hypothetical protein [Symbiobacteriaceae bacterium]